MSELAHQVCVCVREGCVTQHCGHADGEQAAYAALISACLLPSLLVITPALHTVGSEVDQQWAASSASEAFT